MRLLNKKKVIAENVIARKSVIEKMLGLLPYKQENKYVYDYLKLKKFSKNDAMLFESGRSVHTWFMSFPIAVFFLDKNMKVVEKVRLQPFERYSPKEDCCCFAEMTDDNFDKVKVGNRLEVSDE